MPGARYIFRIYLVPKKTHTTASLCQERDLSCGNLPYYINDCENHAWLSTLGHYSAMLEAYPVNFNARQPATSGSIYSGENYKAQSIQMCPTKLNTSSSDKQPLLPVMLQRGNLALQIALEGQQRGGRLHGRKIGHICALFLKMKHLRVFLSDSDDVAHSSRVVAAGHLSF